MDGAFPLTLQIILAVLSGITAQVVAAYAKVPSIVFLLIFGIVLGADGIGLLHPQEIGLGLEVIVSLSVAIILFEGGLNLSLRELDRVSGSLRNLVTFGTLITFLGGSLAAHWLAEFPWSISFLYASLVVVTGPTVISPLLQQVQVDRQIATLLEGEGVLIDPVGAILAVVVLDTLINSNASPLEIVSGLLLRLTIGAAIGGIGGGLLSLFVKQATVISEDLKNLVVLAGVWGLFGLAQWSVSESGLMAMVIAGIVLRASALPEERLLRRFKGQLTVLCVSVLFILLAADLSIESVFALGWGSVFTVLTLMLVVRPLSISLCTFQSDLNWRQKAFLAWIAPRGIISASVASLFAIVLTKQGINGGDAIKALVFLTIMMTVLVQGLTARWVAQWLKISSAEATGAVIVGCNPMGLLLGQIYQAQGESVVLIDTDREACDQAKAENLPTYHSSGLNTQVLVEAGIESKGTFIALTSNGEVNQVLAQRVLEEFNLPRVLAVLPDSSNSEESPKIGGSSQVNPKVTPSFIDQAMIKQWNQYLKDGQVKLARTVFKELELSLQQIHFQALIQSGEVLPLFVRRLNALYIVKFSEQWQLGDEIIYLLHDPRPQLLKRLSGGIQSSQLILTVLPEVEALPLLPSIAFPKAQQPK
jgi:NhaP-type Na+/H+ or K+/H+ antiporter